MNADKKLLVLLGNGGYTLVHPNSCSYMVTSNLLNSVYIGPHFPLLMLIWLVVWNINFIFPYIGNNHPDWLIFFRGVQTTNQSLMSENPAVFCSKNPPGPLWQSRVPPHLWASWTTRRESDVAGAGGEASKRKKSLRFIQHFSGVFVGSIADQWYLNIWLI